MRRELFYVDISHLPVDDLVFFGYSVAYETSEFWLFQCFDGEEQIVSKTRPFLLVDDVNDAHSLRAFKGFLFQNHDKS